MKISEDKKGEIVILSLNGKLDVTTSGDFETKILNMIDKGENKLIVDCCQLDYISSSGLRVFIVGSKKLKNLGGEIVISSLKDSIRNVFDCVGFSPLFRIYDSEEEALKSYYTQNR